MCVGVLCCIEVCSGVVRYVLVFCVEVWCAVVLGHILG